MTNIKSALASYASIIQERYKCSFGQYDNVLPVAVSIQLLKA